MVTYLPAPVRSIETWHNHKRSDQTNEFIWWLIKPTSLKKVRDASFCRTFSLFPRSYQNVAIDWMKDRMSLSDDLSSQNHWGRFVTHSSVEPFQHGNKIRIHRETTWNEIFRSRSSEIHVHSFNPQFTYRLKTQGRYHVTQSNKNDPTPLTAKDRGKCWLLSLT